MSALTVTSVQCLSPTADLPIWQIEPLASSEHTACKSKTGAMFWSQMQRSSLHSNCRKVVYARVLRSNYSNGACYRRLENVAADSRTSMQYSVCVCTFYPEGTAPQLSTEKRGKMNGVSCSHSCDSEIVGNSLRARPGFYFFWAAPTEPRTAFSTVTRRQVLELLVGSSSLTMLHSIGR